MHGLFELLGPAADCLVALGGDWALLAESIRRSDREGLCGRSARTRCGLRRFAEEELRRTKTDAIDALGIARFAQQKRPRAAQLPDAADGRVT